ncbi:TetR/AcrR family transcriptional regulator [Kordiimonas aestuarii]|uniref:TetR/AcrR family transcriptional regulator n=1 Tax=Kordiimonas aestuarii TaxID=1005925 RepID=UPI0021D139D5|nr:TetR/AcrR family transcriptional regulator [Kordiimonas aestuarii]
MTPDKTSPKRGRPRSEETRVRILTATAVLLREEGMPGVTIEAVAARAGVGKPTIYRYWANANELAMAALMETAPNRDAADTAEDAVDDPVSRLRAILHRISETFFHTTGRYVATMLAAAHEDSEVSKAFRSHFIRARRQEAEREMKAAQRAGIISPAADIAHALDMLFGAVFYRLLMEQAPMDATHMDEVLSLLMRGLRG